MATCWVLLARHGAPFIFQSNDNEFLLELIGVPPKTRNVSGCWQEDRLFAENETWVVDSCTSCTCKVRQGPVPSVQGLWAARNLRAGAGGDRCSDGALCMGVRSSWAEQGRGCSGLDLIPPRSLEDQQECSLSRITEMAVHPPCWMGHGVCQPQPRAPDVGQPLRWFLLSSLGAFLAQLGTKKPRAQGTLEPCSVPL